MQLSNRTKVMEQGEMTLAERMYLPAIVGGMATTLKHFFSKPVTIRYPEQQRYLGPIFRGHHILKKDSEGAERCTACGLCAVACPAEAISMVAEERKPGEEKLYREEKYAKVYEINMLRCIFCGLCEEACPKDAIYLSETFAPSDFTRKGFIYGKENLLIPHPVKDKENYELARGQREQQIKNK